MAKQSAGLLLYRKSKDVEVLLVHPGGPFWSRKDRNAWSIPKGEFTNDEDAQAAAKREFQEETGMAPPAGALIELGTAKQSSGKTVYAWAVAGDIDTKQVKSNLFEMEWPPKSGQMQQFPECDKAGWFTLAKAREKLVKGQLPLLEKLAEALHVEIEEPTDTQTSLF